MARNLNENNLDGIENPDLYNYVAEFIPLASTDYKLEFIRGTRRSWICQRKYASLLIVIFVSIMKP